MDTLLDVAQNDGSGSARVSAARTLTVTEMVQRAEDRSDRSDVMRDQSEEIKGLLQLIQQEQLHSA